MATRRNGLAQRRAAVGFTQMTLADHLNIDRTTVGRWERGELTPLPWNQRDLAEALEVTPEQLAELLAAATDTPSGNTELSEPVTVNGDLEPVTKIRATAKAFQAADRRVGGGVLYPSVAQYLSREIAPRLFDPEDEAHSAELFAAAASVTEIAGWMSHDSGQDSRARRHFDRAFRLAKAASDEILAGNACASMAHLAIELNQPDDAVRISSAGLQCTPNADGTKRLISRLHAMRARAFALQVDRASCLEELDLAERFLREADGKHVADWIAVFDEASLASEASLCFMQLAEYSEAELRAKEVIRLRSADRVRSRAFGQLTLANILIHAGRVDEAASLGREVCLLTESLSSARVANRLEDLADSLEAVSNGPAVCEFVTTLRGRADTDPEGHAATWPI